MVERLVPPNLEHSEGPGGLGRHLVIGLVIAALLAAGAGVAYLVLQEEQKYDGVYQRLHMQRLPKALENVGYVQLPLARLKADACNRQAIEDLVSGLETLGQQVWGKVVRTAYFQSCLRNASVATTAQEALEGLANSGDNAEVRTRARQVQQNQCDRPAVRELLRLLQRTLNNTPVTTIGNAYLANCGQDVMVAYATMQSHYHLGQYDRSLALIDTYQKVEPNDPYWPYWRGRNLEKLGRYGEAADAHLRSLTLWPNPANVVLDDYWRTAAMLRAAGRSCEAVKLLERYVSYDPTGRTTPQIADAIRENRSLGACS